MCSSHYSCFYNKHEALQNTQLVLMPRTTEHGQIYNTAPVPEAGRTCQKRGRQLVRARESGLLGDLEFLT